MKEYIAGHNNVEHGALIVPDILDRLAQTALFNGVLNKQAELRKFAELIEIQKYRSSDRIIAEGETGNAMYVLHK